MMTNELIILSICSTVILVLLFWVIRTELRLKKLLSGKDAASLEKIITDLVKSSAQLQKNDQHIEKQITHIESRLRRSIQGIETIRFNPFRDSGGNHSFATALISENGDGVVISSLYARDRVNVFAKPIKQHTSEFELTIEEKEALSRAKK
ncbi:MAG: DUF4446 family protein [Candidatus Pacebacteria bacterium]|jgi:hypothetical protein|nr:DUF4446 family protein [Candidatus Paceibacterota bacterium]